MRTVLTDIYSANWVILRWNSGVIWDSVYFWCLVYLFEIHIYFWCFLFLKLGVDIMVREVQDLGVSAFSLFGVL